MGQGNEGEYEIQSIPETAMNSVKFVLLFILFMIILVPVRAVNAQLDTLLQVTPTASV